MSKRVNIRISESCYDFLRIKAFNENRTMSAIADEIISERASVYKQDSLFPSQSLEHLTLILESGDIEPLKRFAAELDGVLNG